MNFSTIKLVDLIEPSEILGDPAELMELCPVERPKVDLNNSTLRSDGDQNETKIPFGEM